MRRGRVRRPLVRSTFAARSVEERRASGAGPIAAPVDRARDACRRAPRDSPSQPGDDRRRRISPRTSAASRRCATCRSAPPPARRSACSGPTARARRRSCARWPATSRRPAAASRWPASTSRASRCARARRSATCRRVPSGIPTCGCGEFLDFCADVRRLRGPRAGGRAWRRCSRAAASPTCSARLIGHLSKGYRQRVGIAQALLHEPAVLILDEPTVGLDPRQVVEIRALVRALRGRTTVLLSTHILSEVATVCDRVVIIDRGRVVAEDTRRRRWRARSERGRARCCVRVEGPAAPVLRRRCAPLPGVAAVEPQPSDDGACTPSSRPAPAPPSAAGAGRRRGRRAAGGWSRCAPLTAEPGGALRAPRRARDGPPAHELPRPAAQGAARLLRLAAVLRRRRGVLRAHRILLLHAARLLRAVRLRREHPRQLLGRLPGRRAVLGVDGAAAGRAAAHHAAAGGGEEARHHRAAAHLSAARRRHRGGQARRLRAGARRCCSPARSPIRCFSPACSRCRGRRSSASYLGLLLLGVSFIACGLFVSSLTESQVVAAVGDARPAAALLGGELERGRDQPGAAARRRAAGDVRPLRDRSRAASSTPATSPTSSPSPCSSSSSPCACSRRGTGGAGDERGARALAGRPWSARSAAPLALVCAQRLAARTGWRLDLTPERRCVLSEHARGILAALERPVAVTAFLRADDPRNREIEDLLARVAGGSPLVTYADRRPQPQPGAGARASGSTPTARVAVESDGRRRDFANPDEQTLMAAIIQVTRPERRARLLLRRPRRAPASATASAADGYSAANVALINELLRSGRDRASTRDTPVPDDAAALIVAGAARAICRPAALRQIDAYLRRGGGVLVLLDPGQAPEPGRAAAALRHRRQRRGGARRRAPAVRRRLPDHAGAGPQRRCIRSAPR